MSRIPVSLEPVPPLARVASSDLGHRPLGIGAGAVRWLTRFLSALLLLALVGAGDPPVTEGRDEAKEYALKAAYLFKFADYVGWPDKVFEKKDSPFVIAVIGEDPFGEALDRIVEGKRVGEHPIVIRRYADFEAWKPCQILYVAEGLDERKQPGRVGRDEERDEPLIERICQAAEECSALTVSDISHFTRRGGVLRFFLQKNRVRFEINIDAAERAGIQIDSRLLDLAVIVRDEEEDAR